MSVRPILRMFLPYLFIALVIVSVAFVFRTKPVVAPVTTDLPETIEVSNPTNFSEKGYFEGEPDSDQYVLEYTYDKPTTTKLSKKLSFDALSFCATATGSAPCMALSVTYDMAFGGKHVMIEGEDTANSVLVRKLTVIEEGKEFLALSTFGNQFISWPKAQNYIKDCDVSMVMQSHSLNVDITLENGTRYRTVEPVIDEVFKLVETASKTCGNIGIATE